MKQWPHFFRFFCASVFFTLSCFVSGAAFTYSFALTVEKPVTHEIASKLPAALRNFAIGAVYYENKLFLIVQNRQKEFCKGNKCLTYVSANCSKSDCGYTLAFAGTVFARGDAWIKSEIGGETVFPLNAYCKIPGNPKSLHLLSNTFLIAENLAVTSYASSEDCTNTGE